MQPELAKDTARKARVLVVDDDIQGAEGVRDLLDLEGYPCKVAHDGAGANGIALAIVLTGNSEVGTVMSALRHGV